LGLIWAEFGFNLGIPLTRISLLKATMSMKRQDRTKDKTEQKKSFVAVTSAGLVTAMLVMSIGIAIPSSITQQQSAYAHPGLFDPGAQIYRISTQQDEDNENDDDQNGGNSDQQEEAPTATTEEEQSGSTNTTTTAPASTGQQSPTAGNATVTPTSGYDIHVTVNRHDSMNIDAPMDHYCKLSEKIVAVCQLYFNDPEAGGTPILSQIEYIISKDQYLQIPPRERASWHNHAVELTPERGMPSCVSLPPGLTCEQLVSTLVNTYGKVITIWDPADETPSYPPYVFAVDSPFTLGQDLNNNLAKDWPTGCGNNSSANISCN
jgi:hypothetical protein